ncbi:hypothetical protein GEV33_005929 [Tenebrio molitor]|uniref:Uncharacterized protein n=1 Tax=Tenebrio molitor TaxID=7067 RepID=A0A8J6LEH9_TENMO|nr:hypothetical protein GEV33_005929 [Tenebrio molitor]
MSGSMEAILSGDLFTKSSWKNKIPSATRSLFRVSSCSSDAPTPERDSPIHTLNPDSLNNDNKSHPKCQEKYHNEPQIFADGICKMQVVPEHNSQLAGLMKTHGAPSGSRYECTGVVYGGGMCAT